MNEFVMVPYSLINDLSLGDKRVIVYSSVLFSNWYGRNIEDLVSYSRYSVCRDRSGVLYQYKTIISQLIEKNYLSYNDGGMFYIRRQENFGIIYYSEFQKIMHERELRQKSGKRINHAHLLLLLAHIRLFMIRKPNTPEMYSNLLIRISESTGLSVRSISSCIKILEQLNIIHNEELPRYKDGDGCWHSNVRIFVNMESHNPSDIIYDWQQEVLKGIQYIKENRIN